jgi:7-cyano-7-deazaguanine synthase
MNIVLVYSGGLDSTVLLYHLLHEGHRVKALSVNYGQRHARELDAAGAIVGSVGVEHRVIDCTSLGTLFSGSALTNATAEVPLVDYDAASMQMTTVPNRNMLLLALALSWAAQLHFDAAAFAAHAGMTTTYPDCRPAFVEAMDRAAGEADWRRLRVLAPFVTWTKTQVVRRGAELHVPFGQTWSCYVGDPRHCGQCGTCRDRRHAFLQADVPDPTDYARGPDSTAELHGG